MKQILMLGGTAVVLFLLSASASFLLFRHKIPSEPESAKEPATLGTPEGAKGGPAVSEAQKAAAARSSHPPGTEETAKLAANLRERLSAVREKEAQVDVRQRNLELVALDIRSERLAIEELRKQVQEDLKRLDDKLGEIDQTEPAPSDEGQQSPERLKSMKKHTDRQKTVDLGRLSDLGTMFPNLTAEVAAKILAQLMASDKMDKAAELLAEVPERDAAKILALLDDPSLACQLAEKSKAYKRARQMPKE